MMQKLLEEFSISQENGKIAVFDARSVMSHVSMLEAIDLMADAFSTLSDKNGFIPQRVITEIPEDNLTVLYKPAYISEYNRLSIKLLTQKESNVGSSIPAILGMVLLIDTKTGQTLSISDGSTITSLRTGAASGVATKLLSKPDSKVAALFGCGAQGLTQVTAVCAVRDIEKFYLFDLDSRTANDLKNRLSTQLDCDLEVASDISVLKNADIICTATPSKNPLFKLDDVKAGTHINAIGSFRPDMQELDPYLVNSSKLFVDTAESCLEESGDLIKPISKGIFTSEKISAEIGDFILEKSSGRDNAEQVTVFKSVGNAIQDFYIANHLYNKANCNH